MEHENHSLIRSKVLEAEAVAVEWNKNRVLLNIAFPAQKKRPAVWYAAAAIILSTILVFVLRIENQNVAKARVAELEQQILEKNKHQMLKDKSIALVPTEVPCKPGVVWLRKRGNRTATAPTQKEREITPEVHDDIIPLIAKTMPEEFPSVPLTTTAEVQKEKVIEAIVGTIPPPEATVYKIKRKHHRIEINFKPEQSSVAAEELKSFTARLN